LRAGVSRDPSEQPRIGRRLIIYRLDPARPTVFRFSQPVSQARIISNPVIQAGKVAPGKGWSYAYKAELLGAAGQVVETRLVNAHAILFEHDGKRRGAFRFFRGSSDHVALGDEVRIASQQPFFALRLTRASADRDVVAVDVRVSERRPLIAIAAESAFVRFSPDDRERLAAANAFPPALLTREERINLALNQWRPVGPVGVEGRDYVTAVLYEAEQAAEDDEPALGDEEEGG
jgi:hypothetical protein